MSKEPTNQCFIVHCPDVCLRMEWRELFVGISLKKGLFEGHKYPGYLIVLKTEEELRPRTRDDGPDTCQETIHYIHDPGDIKWWGYNA